MYDVGGGMAGVAQAEGRLPTARLLRARVPLAGSLDDQSRQHARLRLCQQEAAQLARRLDVAQARHLLG